MMHCSNWLRGCTRTDLRKSSTEGQLTHDAGQGAYCVGHAQKEGRIAGRQVSMVAVQPAHGEGCHAQGGRHQCCKTTLHLRTYSHTLTDHETQGMTRRTPLTAGKECQQGLMPVRC